MILEKLVAVLGFDLQNEGDVRRFNNGLRSAGREADLLMVGLRRLAKQAAITFGGMAAAWKAAQFVTNITKTGEAFENMAVRLKALEGSAAEAEKAMAWITDFTKRTPLQLDQVTDAYARMRAYGLDPTNGSLQAIADTTAATGGGAEKLNGIVTALGQAWTKQKLQQEEALQLQERGINVWDLLAKSTGKTVPELMKLSTAGKIGRKEISLLIEQMGKRFSGASDDFAKTFSGITSNLMDNWTLFLRAIADSGYFADVKYRLKTLLDWVNAQWDNGTFARWTQAISDGLVAGMAAAERLGKFAWNIGRGFFFAADGILSLGQKITGLEKVWVGLGLGAGAAATTAFGRAALLAIARKVPWIAALLVVEDLILALESPANKTVIGSTAGGRDAIRAAKRGFAELKGAVDDFAASLNKAFGIEADKGGNMAALIAAFSEWAGEWAKGQLVKLVEDLTKAMVQLAEALDWVKGIVENPEDAWRRFADVAIEQIKRIIYALDEQLGGALVRLGIIPSGRTGTWDAPAWEGSSGPAGRPNNRPTGKNKGFGGSGATGSWGETSDVGRRTGGSRSWRNNNPGNIEYGTYAKMMGAIGSDGRFAIFPDYETGRRAQERLLFESSSYKNLTLRQAIARWAPASENNVPAYVKAMGGNPNTRMKDFTPEQRRKLLDDMQRHEGWKPGNIATSEALRLKGGPGGQAVAGGAHHSAVEEAALVAQAKIAGFNRVTAFNDRYHKGTRSRHAQGLAGDFTVNDPKLSSAAAAQMRKELTAAGLQNGRDFDVIDEYKNPSSRSTGGHIHYEFNSREAAERYAAHKRRERQIAKMRNFEANTARIDGASAAASSTLVRDQRAVNQTITVGDVHAAPGERVDRATARAVAGAAASSARVSEPARIAAQPAARP